MQGIFRKENTDKALKYGIYRHLPTYEKIIRNLVSFYNKEALNSSPDFALKYAGAISNTVLHPLCPSLESLYAALAYATKTLDVNSGLESNF